MKPSTYLGRILFGWNPDKNSGDPSKSSGAGRGVSAGGGSMTTHSPSGWKEEELLLKIDGEIKARNPNLEVRGESLGWMAAVD